MECGGRVERRRRFGFGVRTRRVFPKSVGLTKAKRCRRLRLCHTHSIWGRALWSARGRVKRRRRFSFAVRPRTELPRFVGLTKAKRLARRSQAKAGVAAFGFATRTPKVDARYGVRAAE